MNLQESVTTYINCLLSLPNGNGRHYIKFSDGRVLFQSNIFSHSMALMAEIKRMLNLIDNLKKGEGNHEQNRRNSSRYHSGPFTDRRDVGA